MLKVVFMGTPDFAVPALEALHSCKQPALKIVGVYTQPDKPVGRGLEVQPSPVKRKAIEFGLPVFQPAKLSAPGEFDRLRELAPDVIVVVAFGQILKREVLELPSRGCFNIHASLLPRWRGAAPIHWSLLSGDAATGITIMHMAEKLDAGDIVLQRATPISQTDTVVDLHDRLATMGADLMVEALGKLEVGALQRVQQEETKVTYASKLTKDMEWLDCSLSAAELERRVRALNPWPGTSVKLSDGTRLRIRRASLRHDVQSVKGRIFEKAGMLLLGAEDGVLELHSLQWDGKAPVNTAEFINGLRGRGKALPLDISSSSK